MSSPWNQMADPKVLANLRAMQMQSLGQQRALGAQDMAIAQQQLESFEPQMDLSPLAKLVDTWTGGDQYSAYEKPETVKERIAAARSLGDATVAKGNQLTDEQISMLEKAAAEKRAAAADAFNQKMKMMDLEMKKQELDIMKSKAEGLDTSDVKQHQWQAAGYGKRTEDADKIISRLEKSPDFDPTSMSARLQRTFLMPEALKSEAVKSIEQAQRNFVNAILRRESGAAISPSEFESAEKQYFPAPGDTPEILKQKAANRRQAITSLKAEAGKAAWKAVGGALEDVAPKPNQAAGGNEELQKIRSRKAEILKMLGR